MLFNAPNNNNKNLHNKIHPHLQLRGQPFQALLHQNLPAHSHIHIHHNIHQQWQLLGQQIQDLRRFANQTNSGCGR